MERLKHFIIVLSIDALSVLCTSITVFSSVYIKEFDLYIPQRIFIIIALTVPLVYNIVSSVFLTDSSQNYIADVIIPMGIVFSIILAQYFIFSLVIVYMITIIVLIYSLIRHKLNEAKCIIMLIMAVTIFFSIVVTTYFDKALAIRADGNKEEDIIMLTDEEWQEKSVSEKLYYLQTVADFECDKLGCRKTKILAKALQERRNAYQSAYYNRLSDSVIISIHELKQASYINCINTVIHEVRHRYQNEVVRYMYEKKITIDDTNLEVFKKIKLWDESIHHYSNYSDGNREYYEQAIEEDANEYSKIETERILKNYENDK